MVLSSLPSTAVYVPGRRGRHTNGKGVFPVSEGGAVEIMRDNFPMGVIVLGVVVLVIGVIVLGGNCPTGLMVVGGYLSLWVIG